MALADDIAHLEAIINAGARSQSVGDERTEFDLEQNRKRLAELRAQQSPSRRPRCAQINLGNSF